MKKPIVALAAMLVVGGLAGGVGVLAFGSSDSAGSADRLNPVSREESLQIARDFVLDSPTFRFDGVTDTLELVDWQLLRCPYCYAFTFRFQSRHAGYGDRTGMMLAQVITGHEARIVVQEGQVVHAVLDGVWDMLSQSDLKSTAQ